MRLEKINNTAIFRPGDYNLNLDWFGPQDTLETILTIGSILQAAGPRMTITQYQRETLEPFVWSRDNMQKVVSECVAEFLQLRGDDMRLDRPVMVFRTSIAGVDLLLVLQIDHQGSPSIMSSTLDFEKEHLDPVNGVFSSESLQHLFMELVQNCTPDYAVLRRLPSLMDDWYEETRTSINTRKVPVTLEWFNFFSWDWATRIGEKRFDNCPIGEVRRLSYGLLYIMQNEPFSYDNPEHRSRQQEVNKHFELEKLYRKYSI